MRVSHEEGDGRLICLPGLLNQHSPKRSRQ